MYFKEKLRSSLKRSNESNILLDLGRLFGKYFEILGCQDIFW